MDVRLNNLIQFSELTKALEFLNSAILKHDKKLGSLEKQMKAKSEDLCSHQSQIDLLIKEKTRMAGDLKAIVEINAKLDSWSGRFTSLEAKIFEAFEKIQNFKNVFEDEISRIRNDQTRSTASITKDVQDVEKAYHNGQQGILLKLKRLETELENSKHDKIHMFSVISKELDFLHTNTNTETAQEFIVARNSIISDAKSTAFGVVKLIEIEDSGKKEEEQYNLLAQNISEINDKIEHLQEDHRETYANSSHDNSKNDMRNRLVSGNLTRPDQNTIDIINYRLGKLENQNAHLEQNTGTKQEFEHMSTNIEDLSKCLIEYQQKNEGNIEKIFRGLNMCSTQSDLEDLKQFFSNKNKQEFQKKSTILMENEEKLIEFEGRLIDLWNSNNEMNEKLESIEDSVQNNDVKESLENLRKKIHEKLEDRSDEFNNKIKDIYSKLERMSVSFSDIPEKSQDQLKSMISLKSELNKLKSSVEEISQSKPPQIQGKEEIVLEEVTDNMSSELVQKVLKQHGNAIKVLANRLHRSEYEPIQQQIVEDNAHLEHLEKLKKEMKEMINQKNTRSVTQREFELIQQICNSLDQKVNTLEVGHQVDKNNLKQIYRQLKLKIDIVSKEIEGKEQQLHPERPFFIKGRFDSECASCGQNLPKIPCHRPMYSSWARLPSPKNLVGPGFSKILSSIVVNSNQISLPSSEKKKIDRKVTVNKNKSRNTLRKG